MPRDDQGAMPPEVSAALLAIDATLAAEPTDPEYADLAELALILTADRPVPAEPFATALDERVERKFARPARPTRSSSRPTRGWLFGSVAGLAAAVGAVLLVVVLAGHGGGTSSASSSAAASSPPRALSGAAARGSASSAAGSVGGAAQGSASSAAATSSSGPGPAPAPVPSGKRQVVQSAELQLTTAPQRIDAVSQQVFDVVASEKGIVESSNVTATSNPDSTAEFQLSVPSGNLAPTLDALSSLRGADVVSRTDGTTDITGQVGGAGQRLAEARALRRSLLRQLAAATTTSQLQSLRLQLRDADASIASDLATLRKLQRQVAYSQIGVSVQTTAAAGHGSSFTLGRAAHDAGRVLVVVAGAGLIALAVLVPVGLVAAVLVWVGLAIRRRRREHILDLM